MEMWKKEFYYIIFIIGKYWNTVIGKIKEDT